MRSILIERILPALLLFGALVFLLPMFARIINAGNLLGLGLCLGGFLLWCFKTPLHQWYIAHGEQLWFRITSRTVLGLCLLGVLLAVGLTGGMLYGAYGKRTQNADVAIVLGCKVNGTRPSIMLQQRLDAAYAYWTEHPDCLLVVSGGKGSNEDISEAACMYQYLTEKGVPADRILQEDRSTSTRENLRFSKELLVKQGCMPKEIALVTNEFHQLRASMIAKNCGWTVSSIPAHTQPWLIPTYWVREWLGILHHTLLGTE